MGNLDETVVTPVDNAVDTTQEKPTSTNVGGDGNKPANEDMVQMTQSALDKIMGDRAAQAQRSLLSKLGVDDFDSLATIIEAQKQAEEAKVAAEEANKSEFQKLQEQLEASKALYVATLERNKALQIQNAIKDIAPAKQVPASHFEALIKLMDTTDIAIVDGVVNIESVGKALDKTLEANPFLKVAANGKTNGFGSPVRTNKPPSVNEKPQPVKRNRRISM